MLRKGVRMKKKPNEFDLHKFIREYGKAIIAVILILIISFVMVRCSKQEKPEEIMSEENHKVITITSENPSSTKVSTLQKDLYPEITQLMRRYFQARLSRDMETLKQIMNPIEGISEEQLDYEINGVAGVDDFRKIDDFLNITCYTKPGLLADTYVVWVYYEIKFANAQTPAPSLNKMYVCTDDTGVYIYNGAIEGEISNYLDEVSHDQDVAALVEEVNEKLETAIDQDEGLREIFKKLSAESAGDETSSAQEETISDTQE